MKKAITIVLVTVVLVVGVAFFSQYLKNRPFVPESFTEARIAGAAAAQKLGALLDASLANLVLIDQYDQRWDTTNALVIITQEINKSREKIDAAIALSTEMEKMARAITEIRPAAAKQIAFEAVSSGVAAATRIAAYNDYLIQLFDTLKAKFQGKLFDSGEKVKGLITQLNDQGNAINELNKKFTASLEDFDALMKQ